MQPSVPGHLLQFPEHLLDRLALGLLACQDQAFHIEIRKRSGAARGEQVFSQEIGQAPSVTLGEPDRRQFPRLEFLVADADHDHARLCR